jgi:hypothetical protein
MFLTGVPFTNTLPVMCFMACLLPWSTRKSDVLPPPAYLHNATPGKPREPPQPRGPSRYATCELT